MLVAYFRKGSAVAVTVAASVAVAENIVVEHEDADVASVDVGFAVYVVGYEVHAADRVVVEHVVDVVGADQHAVVVADVAIVDADFAVYVVGVEHAVGNIGYVVEGAVDYVVEHAAECAEDVAVAVDALDVDSAVYAVVCVVGAVDCVAVDVVGVASDAYAVE